MALEFQTVDVKFTEGQDTRTQRKLVVPGKWDTLVNYSLSENNTPLRRDGVQALVPTANGNGVSVHGSQLLVTSGPNVSSVSTASATANAVTGLVGNVDITKTELRRNTGMQDTPDCATGNGFTFYAWRDKTSGNVATGINCTLVDETTGARLLDNSVLRTSATAQNVRCVFSDNAFFAFYFDGNSLFCRVITTSAPTTINGEVALITDVNLATGIPFDACAFSSNAGQNGPLVAYGWADGVTSVRAIIVVRTGTVPGISLGPANVINNAFVPVATIVGICCAAGSSTSAAVFASNITGGGITLSGATITNGAVPSLPAAFDTVPTAAAATGCHIAATSDGAQYHVFWDVRSAWGTAAISPIRALSTDLALVPTTLAGNLITSATFAAGAGLARGPNGPFIHGKPFVYGGRVYLPVAVFSVYIGTALATSNPRTLNTQNTFFVLDCGVAATSPTPRVATMVGKALYGVYGVASVNGQAPAVGSPCSSPEVVSGSFATVSGELTLLVLSSAAGNNISPTGLVRLTMTPNFTSGQVSDALGESTYLSGGSISSFDGASISEQGFPLFPEGVACADAGAATGTNTGGVHQVCVIAEWVDNAGQRHQSAPSLPVTVNFAANHAIDVNIPTLLVSQKPDVVFVPFMTQAAGVNFNRVLTNGGSITKLANSTAATNVTFRITSADADIAGNELLYTQPNQAGTTLPNIAPGPCSALASIQNRLFYNKSDRPFFFGYSQQYLNNVGLQFANELEASVSSDSGGITGFAALDEKVVIFCRDKIFVMFGSGPTPSGGFSNYSQPADIQSDAGCSDPLSILEAGPSGVLFKAKQGWHVLKRDLSVEYIGAGVSTFDSATVTSAVLMGDRKEARFTLTTGRTLVFSTLLGQWSVFQYSGNVAIADAVWWPTTSRYAWTGVSLGLNNDVPGVLTDTIGTNSASSFLTKARTGWLKVGALEGFQRVRWLYLTGTAAAAPTSSSFFVTVDYDDVYSGLVVDSVVVNLGSIAFPDPSAIDLRHKIAKKQKCKSIAFTFQDLPATNERPLGGIQAIALEIGLKRGVHRLPATQTVG